MELVTHGLALLVGLGLGAMGYRYMLKRNPAKLEALAKQIKERTHA